MAIPETIGAAKVQLVTFLMQHGNELPAFAVEHLRDAQSCPSDVDLLMRSIEALYAVGEALTPPARALLIDLLPLVMDAGWHGILDDNRGARMRMAMQRESGVEPPLGREWPAADTDPAPAAHYVEPVAPEPVDTPGEASV